MRFASEVYAWRICVEWYGPMEPQIFILVLLVGLILLVVGWRGRRVGDEPHCRKCKYNLTGAVSANCPECGSALSRRSIGWGLRRPFLVLMVAAVLILGSDIAYQWHHYDRRQWLPYYPFWLILRQAENHDPDVFVEILARDRRGDLTDAQRQELIESGLQSIRNKGVSIQPSSLEMALISFRAQLWLTDEQEDRFHLYFAERADRAALSEQ